MKALVIAAAVLVVGCSDVPVGPSSVITNPSAPLPSFGGVQGQSERFRDPLGTVGSDCASGKPILRLNYVSGHFELVGQYGYGTTRARVVFLLRHQVQGQPERWTVEHVGSIGDGSADGGRPVGQPGDPFDSTYDWMPRQDGTYKVQSWRTECGKTIADGEVGESNVVSFGNATPIAKAECPFIGPEFSPLRCQVWPWD